MNYINLSDNQANSSIDNIGSVGTEHNVLNDNFNMIVQKLNQNGGNINDKYDDLMIEAAKDGNFNVVFYLIGKQKIKDISIVDSDGNNILHYFVINFNKLNRDDAKLFLAKLTSMPLISKLINVKNNIDGNTPLHIAVAHDLDDIADELIKYGADKNITNKNNEYVAKDSETENITKNNFEKNIVYDDQYKKHSNSNVNNNIYGDKYTNSKNNNSNVFIQKKNEKQPDSIIDNIVKLFVGDKNPSDTSDASLRMTATDIKPKMPNTLSETSSIGTSDIINNVINNKASHINNNTSDIVNNVINNKVSRFDNNTSDIVDDIMKNKLQLGGKRSVDKNVSTNYYDNTNYLRRQMGYGDDKKTNKKQSEEIDDSDSGKINKKQSRAMDNNNKVNMKKSRSVNSDSSDSNNNELSRLINNQATAIHERTVKKIMEILGIDENDAQIYKAALYESVKNDSPELNNYDRAVEMEKRANVDTLKRIDLKQWKKKISDIKGERNNVKEDKSNMKEKKRPVRYNDSTDMSNTSVLSVTSSS